MKYIIIIIFFLIVNILSSQTYTEHPTEIGNLQSKSFIKSSDGYYVSIIKGADALIVKLDNDYNVLWQDSLGKVIKSDGNVLDKWIYSNVGISINSDHIRINAIGTYGILPSSSSFQRVILFDKKGNRLSDSLCFCEENWYGGRSPKMESIDEKDSFIAWSKYTGKTVIEHNAVVRVDENGIRQWLTVLDTNILPYMYRINDVTIDEDKNLWLVGHTEVEGETSLTPPYLAKVSYDGNELGRYSANINEKYTGYDISIINNKPVLIGGWLEYNDDFRFGFKYRVRLLKLENNQIVETDIIYDEMDYVSLDVLLKTSDGGLMLVLQTSELSDKLPEVVYSTQDILFVKLDSNLNEEWRMKYGKENQAETFYQAIEEASGKYTFAGRVGGKYTLVKVENTVTNIEVEQTKEYNSIDIYDLSGRFISTIDSKDKIDKNNFKSGTYILQFSNKNNELVKIEKLIITK